MTSFWQLPAAVLSLLIAFTSGPGNLGMLSRREAMRRQMTGPSTASLSNQSLPEPPPAAVSREAPPVTAAAEVGQKAAEAASEEKKKEEKKDETWWRDRIAKARQALARDTAALPAAETTAAAMTTEVVNMDDPARQSKMRQQLMVTLAEVERLKGQIEADKKAIADIQGEARRAGVPPGWVR